MRVSFLALAAALVAAVAPQETESGPALPKVGKPAPSFRLNDHTGKAVRVGGRDENGWTVLAFFPKAATPG